jgi:hypothetical protein
MTADIVQGAQPAVRCSRFGFTADQQQRHPADLADDVISSFAKLRGMRHQLPAACKYGDQFLLQAEVVDVAPGRQRQCMRCALRDQRRRGTGPGHHTATGALMCVCGS